MTDQNTNTLPLKTLQQTTDFIGRHIGPNQTDVDEMLKTVGVNSLAELIDKTIPESIRERDPLKLNESVSEQQALTYLKHVSKLNKVNKSYIGMGYYDTIIPSVILRNVLENPGWYTAYTPYQPEISQGRLEALLNYQQMVIDLTGMEMANASMLDEATAAAEAMALCKRSNRLKTDQFFVDENIFPQTLDVLKTRAKYFGFELIIGDPKTELSKHEVFGVQLQYPGQTGAIDDIESIIKQAHEQKALVTIATDLMALVMLKSPGEIDADIVIGTSQRFGVPMGNGGPHAAFFAVRDKFKRAMPGRVIGVSIDSQGNQALRMAMQTREQHIRRDKATSNICTAQALLANIAGFYATYHGASGLKLIAGRIHRLTTILAAGLKQEGVKKGIEILNDSWFDTLVLKVDDQQSIYQHALDAGVNLRLIEHDKLGISIDETKTVEDIHELFNLLLGSEHSLAVSELDTAVLKDKLSGIPANYVRESDFLTHETFNRYHSETEMMRYLKQLENKDLSLTHEIKCRQRATARQLARVFKDTSIRT